MWTANFWMAFCIFFPEWETKVKLPDSKAQFHPSVRCCFYVLQNIWQLSLNQALCSHVSSPGMLILLPFFYINLKFHMDLKFFSLEQVFLSHLKAISRLNPCLHKHLVFFHFWHHKYRTGSEYKWRRWMESFRLPLEETYFDFNEIWKFLSKSKIHNWGKLYGYLHHSNFYAFAFPSLENTWVYWLLTHVYQEKWTWTLKTTVRW